MDAVKRIWKIISTALVAVAVALAVALVGVRLFGLDVYAVLSGSMEPTYRTGSVIWVAEREPADIEVGDPITFVLNEDLVVATHRVIAIDEETGEFATQGDANDAPDGSPVLFENLIGEPVFTVPYLGYLVNYVQTPPGLYVAIAACAVLLILMLLPDIFAKEEKPEAEQRQRDAARAARQQRAGQPGRHAQAQPVANAVQIPRGQQARTAPSTQARQYAYATARSRQQRAAFQPQVASTADSAFHAQSNNPRVRAQSTIRDTSAYEDRQTASTTKGGK